MEKPPSPSRSWNASVINYLSYNEPRLSKAFCSAARDEKTMSISRCCVAFRRLYPSHTGFIDFLAHAYEQDALNVTEFLEVCRVLSWTSVDFSDFESTGLHTDKAPWSPGLLRCVDAYRATLPQVPKTPPPLFKLCLRLIVAHKVAYLNDPALAQLPSLPNLLSAPAEGSGWGLANADGNPAFQLPHFPGIRGLDPVACPTDNPLLPSAILANSHHGHCDKAYTATEPTTWWERVFFLAGRYFRIHQRPYSSLGVGAVVWEGAVISCLVLEQLGREFLAGKRLMDLGCGTGISGVVAAAMGCSVVLSDLDTPSGRGPPISLLGLVRLNCDLNASLIAEGGGRIAGVLEVMWGEPIPKGVGEFDVILANEVIYDYKLFGVLISCMISLCTWPQPSRVILTHKRRYAHHEANFLLLAERFFHVSWPALPPGQARYPNVHYCRSHMDAVVLMELVLRVEDLPSAAAKAQWARDALVLGVEDVRGY